MVRLSRNFLAKILDEHFLLYSDNRSIKIVQGKIGTQKKAKSSKVSQKKTQIFLR